MLGYATYHRIPSYQFKLLGQYGLGQLVSEQARRSFGMLGFQPCRWLEASTDPQRLGAGGFESCDYKDATSFWVEVRWAIATYDGQHDAWGV